MEILHQSKIQWLHYLAFPKGLTMAEDLDTTKPNAWYLEYDG